MNAYDFGRFSRLADQEAPPDTLNIPGITMHALEAGLHGNPVDQPDKMYPGQVVTGGAWAIKA